MAPPRKVYLDPKIPGHVVDARMTDEELGSIVARMSGVQVEPGSGTVVFLDIKQKRLVIDVDRFSVVYEVWRDGSIYILMIDPR